jgi:hypothetical protein
VLRDENADRRYVLQLAMEFARTVLGRRELVDADPQVRRLLDLWWRTWLGGGMSQTATPRSPGSEPVC